MGEILESKKLVKYESGKEYLATIQYIPSSNTHIITHKGDFKKGFFLKDFALDFTKLFGEPFISSVGKIPLFIFIITWILLFFVLTLIYQTPKLGTFLIALLFILGLLAMKLKFQFSYIAEYYRNAKCNNCGKEFICRETDMPDFKEISTPENYRIEATRYWGCRSCGYINIRKNYEGFDTKKGKKMKFSSLVKIPCKRCGKTGAYIESKKPDIIRSESRGREELVKRSYFRCKFCRFEDLKGVEFISYPYDDSPGPSFFMYDVNYEDYPY
ncbi:hypothetical protein EO95_14225 [Methanosarcina sp. 1.H.T.1A.1]|uniref:hypothetical protein n=1 Tax=Methanosarcina sp. 1.H.T.1A.1 TaxID=1483602 RepID=UPI000621336B|nr:hypothetical protein [Methanosarcina sp. 1.H.T.1A.1]KKI00420.1 hypothetical protein EO95_14225 [Methanosarcina sp. 1.H.T.1A.1]